MRLPWALRWLHGEPAVPTCQAPLGSLKLCPSSPWTPWGGNAPGVDQLLDVASLLLVHSSVHVLPHPHIAHTPEGAVPLQPGSPGAPDGTTDNLTSTHSQKEDHLSHPLRSGNLKGEAVGVSGPHCWLLHQQHPVLTRWARGLLNASSDGEAECAWLCCTILRSLCQSVGDGWHGSAWGRGQLPPHSAGQKQGDLLRQG